MMEDTTVTTNSTANQAVWTSAPKQQIFWGNQEAFANLEKFEQISNPTLDQDFNFDIEDSLTTEENTESEQTKSTENSILDVENIFESVAKAEPIKISKPEVAVSESVSEPESVLEPETEISEIKEEVSEFKAPEDIIGSHNKPLTTTESSEQTASTPQEVSRKEIPSQDIWSFNEDKIEIKKETTIKPEPASNSFSEPKQEQEKQINNTKDQRITETKVEIKHENKLPENQKFNNKEEKVENKEETAPQNKEVAAHQKLEFEPTPESTQIIKKYFHLLNNISKILTTQESLTGKKTNEFSILTPTENETITYITSLEENTASLNIRKIIQKSGQEEEKHHLNFNLKSPKKNLIVTIDNFKLYEEEVDLTDASKALNVTNKFSKFEFLYREELSKLEDELEEKEKKKQTKVFSTIFHQF